MKLNVLIVTAICVSAVACKKSISPVAAPSDEPRIVHLQLTGDINTSESPLPGGRQKGHTGANARTLRDSTLYAVLMKKVSDNTIFLRGLYNRPDSIFIELPADDAVQLTAVAYRRGSGPGLAYTWQNGQQYFLSPYYSTIKSKIDTIDHYNWSATDSVGHQTLFDPLDSTRTKYGYCLELDAFRGTQTLTAATAPASISFNMRRLAFGIQFTASNFTAGKLIAEFPDIDIAAKTFTPANMPSQNYIHSLDEFKRVDSLTYSYKVRMKWEKPDGTVVTLGEKGIYFKRNILTNIHVTIPNSGRVGLGIDVTEANWTNTETIDF